MRTKLQDSHLQWIFYYKNYKQFKEAICMDMRNAVKRIKTLKKQNDFPGKNAKVEYTKEV